MLEKSSVIILNIIKPWIGKIKLIRTLFLLTSFVLKKPISSFLSMINFLCGPATMRAQYVNDIAPRELWETKKKEKENHCTIGEISVKESFKLSYTQVIRISKDVVIGQLHYKHARKLINSI